MTFIGVTRTTKPSTDPRHAPVGAPRDSMNSLKRFRSPSTVWSRTPRKSPRFSIGVSGSTSISSVMRVTPSETRSKRTTPAFRAPLVLVHATISSGRWATILASQSFCCPAISAFQCRCASSSCWTDFTPSMKRGNSSNCVHWSYATLTGTLTSRVFSTRLIRFSSAWAGASRSIGGSSRFGRNDRERPHSSLVSTDSRRHVPAAARPRRGAKDSCSPDRVTARCEPSPRLAGKAPRNRGLRRRRSGTGPHARSGSAGWGSLVPRVVRLG